MGLWYSPFRLETVGVKEPPDAGSIPAPATSKEKDLSRTGLFLCFAEVHGIERPQRTERSGVRRRRKRGGVEDA